MQGRRSQNSLFDFPSLHWVRRVCFLTREIKKVLNYVPSCIGFFLSIGRDRTLVFVWRRETMVSLGIDSHILNYVHPRPAKIVLIGQSRVFFDSILTHWVCVKTSQNHNRVTCCDSMCVLSRSGFRRSILERLLGLVLIPVVVDSGHPLRVRQMEKIS